MHRNGAARNHDDLGGSPSQGDEHSKQEEDGEDHLGGRVSLGEFPKAENRHLRESDQG